MKKMLRCPFIIRKCNYTLLQYSKITCPYWSYRYKLMPDNIYTVENNAAGKGLMSYIVEGVSLYEKWWLDTTLQFSSNFYFLILHITFVCFLLVTFIAIFYFLSLQRADMILGAIGITPSRYKYLNFPYPYVIGQLGFVIPMPKSKVHFDAVWKPFQQEVSHKQAEALYLYKSRYLRS